MTPPPTTQPDCLKQPEPLRRSVLFVYTFVKSWWIDSLNRCCRFYILLRVLWRLLASRIRFGFTRMFEESDAQLAHDFSAVKKKWVKVGKKERRNKTAHCRVNWCCCKIFHNHAALSHQNARTQSVDFSLLSWTIMWLPLLPENSQLNQTFITRTLDGGELIISLALYFSKWRIVFHGAWLLHCSII